MRNRNNRVQVRFSDSEYLYFAAQVKKSGLRTNEAFLRRLVLNSEVSAPQSKDYLKLTKEVNAVGNNINQIAHMANMNGGASAASIAKCHEYQAQLLQLLRRELYGSRENS